VLHISYLQNAQRRLASLVGEQTAYLDTLRTVELIKSIQHQYDKIHIAGVSYGGLLSVTAYRVLLDKYPEIANKIGVIYSIEGYTPTAGIVKTDSDHLFNWTYEMVFPGEPEADYRRMVGLSNVYMAYSSCWKKDWLIMLGASVRPKNVVYFKGKHEFKPDLLLKVLDNTK
jgi:hypothetical protein